MPWTTFFKQYNAKSGHKKVDQGAMYVERVVLSKPLMAIPSIKQAMDDKPANSTVYWYRNGDRFHLGQLGDTPTHR